MPRLVYACRFEIPSERGLEEVALTYSDWIVDHYQRNHGALDFSFDLLHMTKPEVLPDKHVLFSIPHEIDAERVYEIYWSHPDAKDAGLRWLNEIRFGQFGDRCNVEHQVSVNSIEYSVTGVDLLPGSPRVVRDICSNTSALVGDMQIKAIPYDLEQNNFDDFIHLLISDRRKLPIVFLSPHANGNSSLIDIERMAAQLAGVAVVVHTSDPEVIWDFSGEVGRSLSCFNGAARIYWPGFSADSRPREHPLFLGEQIDKSPVRIFHAILKTIFDIAAFRFVPDQKITDLVRRVESEQQEKDLKRVRTEGIEEVVEIFKRDSEKLRKAKQRIEELEIENAILKGEQKAFFVSESTSSKAFEESSEEENLKFLTVEDAVQAAEDDCGNIEILDSAHRASRKSHFIRPTEIYEVLVDLSNFVDIWRENPTPEKKSIKDLVQYLENQGWGRSRAHISATARRKYRSDYEFKYKEKKQLFEPHVTVGAKGHDTCASVHFIFDQDIEKIVVAHAGKHLPTATGH